MHEDRLSIVARLKSLRHRGRVQAALVDNAFLRFRQFSQGAHFGKLLAACRPLVVELEVLWHGHLRQQLPFLVQCFHRCDECVSACELPMRGSLLGQLGCENVRRKEGYLDAPDGTIRRVVLSRR